MQLGFLEAHSADIARKEWVAGLIAYNLIRWTKDVPQRLRKTGRFQERSAQKARLAVRQFLVTLDRNVRAPAQLLGDDSEELGVGRSWGVGEGE
jgi:hypothetical protein